MKRCLTVEKLVRKAPSGELIVVRPKFDHMLVQLLQTGGLNGSRYEPS